MKSTSNIPSVFTSLRSAFEAQDNIREKIRERRDVADVCIRQAQHALVQLHDTADLKKTGREIRQLLNATGKEILSIESVLPKDTGSFHRYADLWAMLRQTVSMIAVVVDFIESESLPGIPRVIELCGGIEFRLPLEDFLVGVCNAISEFVRLSMNRVIHTDYTTPARCAIFATQVFEAFRELNFRNDFLRKRYDGVKYDVKRLEEIVYDLSIRGLLLSPCAPEKVKTDKDGKKKDDGDDPNSKEEKETKIDEVNKEQDTMKGGENETHKSVNSKSDDTKFATTTAGAVSSAMDTAE